MTKSPWKLADRRRDPRIDYPYFDTDYFEIMGANLSKIAVVNPELESDAKLIQRAPELLEMLKAINFRLTDLNSRGLLPNDSNLKGLIRESFDLTETLR